MRVSTFITSGLCAAGALAQTPSGTTPSTNANLGVSYGSTAVVPNILLPQQLTATQPSTIYSNTTYPSTYMLLLVDLSISTASYNSTVNLAPGLGTNRTTRLHWWTLDVTQQPNGTFSIPPPSNSSTPALYGGPRPPAGDIPHTYTFYLLPQPANYAPSAAVRAGLYSAATASTRVNFSISALADMVGAPVAGNYFRVQNTTGTAAATTSAMGANATASATGGVAGATGSGTPSRSAPAAIYTGAGARILATNAALFVVGTVMFVWL